jgi:hypothetical protein
MPEIPPAMYTAGRHPVPHFERGEYLYRRVPHELWDPDADPGELPIDVDAVEMPDMSVGRSRFAHPEWLRLAAGCEDWGVVGFQVQDIPQPSVGLTVLATTSGRCTRRSRRISLILKFAPASTTPAPMSMARKSFFRIESTSNGANGS